MSMDGYRFIHTLILENFLSYGEEPVRLDLQPLNVIIGPNASGKSNLLEVLNLLRFLPKDLSVPIREGGGVQEWIWKGGEKSQKQPALEAHLSYAQQTIPLRYRLQFAEVGQRLELVDECLENLEPSHPDAADVYFFYRYQRGNPVLNVRQLTDADPKSVKAYARSLKREDLQLGQSVLAQRQDPDLYPELTYVARTFATLKFYREWNLGRYTPARIPQKTDLPDDFLLEDASNLSLVINNLQNQKGSRFLTEKLQQFYDRAEEIQTRIQGGTVQLFLREQGLEQPIPATRLSDGTLRYLCLLTILCHPTPPPLICIEEPELGLHPDILPVLAELLIEASQRTQLVITTHSDVLISALGEYPEAVVVCEQDAWGSQLRRLDKEQLQAWLENYALGELWRMGELGGNRW